MSRILRYFPLAIIVVLLDQATKYWAYQRLRVGSDITVIDGLFKLSYAENPGIAFGIFSNSPGQFKVYALAAVSLIAISLVCYFAYKTAENNRLLMIALMLVLGGITGNLIDRLHLQVVIDFIELYYRDYHWPTFNIADAAICVGAALLSIDILREPADAADAVGANETAIIPTSDQSKEGAGK